MDQVLFATALLAVVLIHGYSDDASVWDQWVKWLTEDNFISMPITFSGDDRCGTVQEHAADLDRILNGSEVNIIAYSKGGLDARWYISHYADKVDNLVMIATPNRGTDAANMDLTECGGAPGVDDLKPGAQATLSPDQDTTKYFTIAGNYPSPSYFVLQRPVVDHDGLVTVDSVQSHYNVSVFPYNHTGLLTHKDVYDQVLSNLYPAPPGWKNGMPPPPDPDARIVICYNETSDPLCPTYMSNRTLF